MNPCHQKPLSDGWMTREENRYISHVECMCSVLFHGAYQYFSTSFENLVVYASNRHIAAFEQKSASWIITTQEKNVSGPNFGQWWKTNPYPWSTAGWSFLTFFKHADFKCFLKKKLSVLPWIVVVTCSWWVVPADAQCSCQHGAQCQKYWFCMPTQKPEM